MMDKERYRRIDEIFQAALELQPEDRAAYIHDECNGDQSLIREVEYLLGSDDRDWELIETPAFELAAPLLAKDEPDLTAGDEVGHYRIVSLLGAGGMGQVYLAEDTRLGRKVALKLLPRIFTGVESRLHRFHQEARAASALNHPNILTIHELGEVRGQQFIATELVEGETLRDRLKRAPLNLAETLDIAVQIGGALAAAHKAGIIHRDIKPENIMLRHDGYAKVLDFGLAKLTEQDEPGSQADPDEKPGISSGMLMGTVRYMSPEQACGYAVDARSDIFSFAVVIYEMLSGRTPFDGETSSELIAGILNTEPEPLTNLPADTTRVVSKGLAKEKVDRYQTVQELLIDLNTQKQALATAGANGHSGGQSLAAPETGSGFEVFLRWIRSHKAIVSASILGILTLIGVVAWFGQSWIRVLLRASPRDITTTVVAGTDRASNVAISPDGKYLAYAEMSPRYLQNSGQQVCELEIATGSRRVIVPPSQVEHLGLTYSRDGKRLYYLSGGDLYEMPAAGGEATRRLAGVESFSLSPDGGRVAYLKGSGPEEIALVVAQVDGSDSRVLATRRKPQYLLEPAWAPDATLVACWETSNADNETWNLTGFDVGTGNERRLTKHGLKGPFNDLIWFPDGTGLLGASNGQIWQIGHPEGEAFKLAENTNDFYSQLGLSVDGKTLVAHQSAWRSSIWVAPDRDAKSARRITSGERGVFRHVAWTPDNRILYASTADDSRDIWIVNGDGTNAKQLTTDGDYQQAQASADGRFIVLASNRAGKSAFNIWRMSIDGSDPVQLTQGSGEVQPIFSPDGRWIVYSKGAPNTTSEEKTLWRVSFDGGQPVQLSDHPSSGAAVSPDGTMVACWYQQEPKTPMRLALIPFAGGPPIKVFDVIRNGIHPVRWSSDGQSLTFIKSRTYVSNIWSQPVAGGPPTQITRFTDEVIQGFDWSRDGRLACSRAHAVQDVVLITNFR
jgi:serine/threonine protein kinase/Tol biopolymer transport system component